jgi:DNA-binding protein HU-beta
MAGTKPETIATSMLANELADQYKDIPKPMIKKMISSLLSNVESHVAQGKKIRLDKIGILSVKEASARKGRNPQTGQEIMIPARKKITFRTASSLKEAVGLKVKSQSKKNK